jgi:hypothetical protein
MSMQARKSGACGRNHGGDGRLGRDPGRPPVSGAAALLAFLDAPRAVDRVPGTKGVRVFVGFKS